MIKAPDYDIPRSFRRERLVLWHDPKEARRITEGLSGLQIMQGIRDGVLPPPPMASLIGMRCILAEPGEVSMQLHHDPSLENPFGMLHGGGTAALLDTALGTAVLTCLKAWTSMVTVDLHVTFVRPIDHRNAPVIANGKVWNMGRRMACAVGEIRDGNGDRVAHATGNFSIGGAAPVACRPDALDATG